MNSRLPRSSFHHDVVTASGARRSTSRASAIPARRTAMKSQSVLIAQEDVHAPPAGRLRVSDQPEFVEQRLEHVDGDRAGLLEAGARLRIEVDTQLVGMLGVRAAHLPRMQA